MAWSHSASTAPEQALPAHRVGAACTPLTGLRDKQLEGTGSNLSSLNLLYYSGSSPLIFVSQTPKLQNTRLISALVKIGVSARTLEKFFNCTKATGMHKKLLTI